MLVFFDNRKMRERTPSFVCPSPTQCFCSNFHPKPSDCNATFFLKDLLLLQLKLCWILMHLHPALHGYSPAGTGLYVWLSYSFFNMTKPRVLSCFSQTRQNKAVQTSCISCRTSSLLKKHSGSLQIF